MPADASWANILVMRNPDGSLDTFRPEETVALLADEQIDAIRPFAEELEIPADQLVFREGQTELDFVVVLRGGIGPRTCRLATSFCALRLNRPCWRRIWTRHRSISRRWLLRTLEAGCTTATATVARNMLGHRDRFDDIPFFWSAVQLSIKYSGHVEHWDETRIDGNVMKLDCAVSYIVGGKVRATATINRDRQNLQAEIGMERDLLLKPPH